MNETNRKWIIEIETPRSDRRMRLVGNGVQRMYEYEKNRYRWEWWLDLPLAIADTIFDLTIERNALKARVSELENQT